MEGTEYRRIAGTDEIEVGKSLCVTIESREILICHIREGYFAVDNICSHARARMSEGRLRGHRVFCPLHSAAFDVRDGSVLSRPATKPLHSHPLRVEAGDILISISDALG